MRTRAILLIIAGAVVLVPLVAFLAGPRTGEMDRYRVTTDLVVDDHGRELRNAVVAECSEHISSNWNTGTQHGIVYTGDDPFVVLSDRSFLLLRDLRTCPPLAAKGSVYTYDADLTSQAEGTRIRMPYSHAWLFDNIDDPTSVKIYSQQELFRGGVDGLRIKDAKLSFTGRDIKEPLPFTGENAFPWLAATPWAEVGKQDYSDYLHLSTFSGFEVRLNQLAESQRCQKFDKEADGPILVEGDVWDTCPPWGATNLGWLTATPSADYSRVNYSYDIRSLSQIATFYRAKLLAAKGAPGARDGNDFYWQPSLCFDGVCFPTQASRRSVWEGFRLYYPKKNQVIAVNWKSPSVSTMFYRREKQS